MFKLVEPELKFNPGEYLVKFAEIKRKTISINFIVLSKSESFIIEIYSNFTPIGRVSNLELKKKGKVVLTGHINSSWKGATVTLENGLLKFTEDKYSGKKDIVYEMNGLQMNLLKAAENRAYSLIEKRKQEVKKRRKELT
jgi:hypothetical protein